jgi:hypothetical protein
MLIFAFDILCFSVSNLCLIRQVPSTAEYFPILSEDEENPDEGGSTANIKFCAEDNDVLEGEDNDSANPEAFSTDHRTLADELTDTAESNHDNDADRAPFVHAADKETFWWLCGRR